MVSHNGYWGGPKFRTEMQVGKRNNSPLAKGELLEQSSDVTSNSSLQSSIKTLGSGRFLAGQAQSRGSFQGESESLGFGSASNGEYKVTVKSSPKLKKENSLSQLLQHSSSGFGPSRNTLIEIGSIEKQSTGGVASGSKLVFDRFFGKLRMNSQRAALRADLPENKDYDLLCPPKLTSFESQQIWRQKEQRFGQASQEIDKIKHERQIGQRALQSRICNGMKNRLFQDNQTAHGTSIFRMKFTGQSQDVSQSLLRRLKTKKF